ncbi:ATP-binding protein [Chryseobacterium salivictor]|uniref:Proteasome-associated ATPase n=1 Tax=Chryseobacterium salivictor TaxID=2547600 RepID=A0A4P6ZHV4_9FLAO|nr:ATP-binding protein [Chryseobacterium salivictor]QBO58965.1 Proteasome-associated ATPase [Chryseobacterium salivictor]
MKLAALAKELKIPTESFIKFIQDFDLELSECITTNFEVKDDFVKFARENIIFLRKYSEDLNQNKSIEDIAENINKPTEKVAEIIKKDQPRLFDNGKYRSSVSSFGIDHKLGGHYEFVYNYFGKATRLAERDFIGYRDLFFFISQNLEPYLSNLSVEDWGIHKPAGIILYGPPGSGKIFWAKKIAEIIEYEFKEIKKHFLGTSFVDNQKITFNDFLIQAMKSEKVLLFLEDFDQLMVERSEEQTVKSCDEETKEIILHYISHFEQEKILMVGAANSLEKIDKELLAPGRFDMFIPIFPPNTKERSEMLFYHMTHGLGENALLMKILEYNKAHQLPFWLEIAKKMQVFSNTMLIDFTQSLKKRIRNIYLKDHSTTIEITQKMLNASLRDASSKLTGDYLNQIQQFIFDVTQNNYEDFTQRIEALKKELEHYKVIDEPKKPIGFNHND